MRKIGLDIGDVRIGIAMSDPTNFLSSGLETYTRQKKLEYDVKYLADLAKKNGADEFVLGLPLNMDGTEGERVQAVRDFAAELEKVTDAKIVFQDERLSTVGAINTLIEAGMRREKRKEVVDKVAATLILQCYLDKQKNKRYI